MTAYSFMDVACHLTGPTGSVDVGYGAQVADEGIQFTMTGDKNTMTTGSDGEVMHSLHAEKSARAVIRLLKTSPTNAILMAMYNAQTANAALHGQNVITCSQAGAGDLSVARRVAFKKKPDLAYAKEGGLVEWELDCGKFDSVLGTY